jgi:hypothetical protein
MWFAAGLALTPVELPEEQQQRRSVTVRAAPSATVFVAWRAGNERAGNVLFRSYREQLAELLRRITGRTDVDDDVQDVLLAVLANRHARLNSSHFEDALLDEVERLGSVTAAARHNAI